MIKTKTRFKTILALTVLFALILSLAIGTLSPFKKASADTYSPSTIFSSGTGGSVGASEKDGEGNSYVQFTLNDGGAVYFRRDLALKWYEASAEEDDTENEESALANAGVLRYLTMEFSFSELNFNKFSLVFQSAEENISKEGTSTNSVVFKNNDGTVSVAVQNASEQDNEEWDEEGVEVDVSEGVVFALSEIEPDGEECEIGEFAVYINGVYAGNITNVGGYYLEYLSTASDTPRVPMAFMADELAEGAASQLVYMKEINNQTFDLDENGKVVDNAAPVLVLNEKVYAYTLGKAWSLSYATVDVCDTTITVSRYYYMLAKDGDGNYVKAENEDYKSLTTSTYFLPANDTDEKEEQYVSIRFQLTDDSGIKDDGDGYIYLTWYAADNAVVTLGEEDEAFDYILVNRNEVGSYYIGIEADEETKENVVSEDALEAEAAYQEAVTEAAEGLSAGDGAYFYLPSLRALIGSDYADYRNLTFTVYYYKQSQASGASASSATSLKYNTLKFEIDEIGRYLFCVLAVDASSNAMQYYLDGELVTLSSSNIWDIDEIPKFSFEVSYTAAKIEDPGEQDLGYRDSSYSISSFDIVALSGYETEYKLYYLDENAMLEDGVQAPFTSYSDLVENIAAYLDVLSPYLVEINEFNSDVSEDDDAWSRTDNDYYWYPDSLTFTPVKVGYYVVELTVSEVVNLGSIVNGYQVIDVRNPVDSPVDSTYWLENNIASVVLFSISAVLAIVIVILFVVKPSDTTVDEVDLAKLKKSKNRKKAVMKNIQKKDSSDDKDDTTEE